jgi:putative endonuclease
MKTGQLSEKHAAIFLKRHGLKPLTKNYSCTMGEIDLIMQDQSTLVFVEVRTRHNPNYGSALESVDFKKQQKLTKTALHYLQQKNLYNRTDCRFDVVAVSHPDKTPTFEWIKNAFEG